MTQKKKVNKLHDVEVQAVGLVTVGANGEQFYLLKSQQGAEETMTDQVMEDVVVEETQDDVAKGLAARIWESLKSKFTEVPSDEEAAVEKASEAEVVAEQQPEVANEAQVEPEVVAEVEKAAPVVDDRDVLMKANVALAERLEAVEKQLQETQDEKERLVYVQKAQEFSHLGVDGATLADNLHFIAKADKERYAFWTGLLAAVEARTKDTELFEEIGKSADTAGDPQDFETKLVDLIKNGDAKSIREKLASMDRDQAREYLSQRHAAMRK